MKDHILTSIVLMFIIAMVTLGVLFKSLGIAIVCVLIAFSIALAYIVILDIIRY